MGHPILKLAAAAATLCVVTSALADTTVYDMVGTGGNFSYTSGSEYGDQIQLAPGENRILTSFSFDYSANYALAGGLTFRLYDQTGVPIGGQASPGLLLDTYTTDILNNGATVHINYPHSFANTVPDTLTYTVQFAGLTAGRTAGLIAPGGTPVVGLSAKVFNAQSLAPGPVFSQKNARQKSQKTRCKKISNPAPLVPGR